MNVILLLLTITKAALNLIQMNAYKQEIPVFSKVRSKIQIGSLYKDKPMDSLWQTSIVYLKVG